MEKIELFNELFNKLSVYNSNEDPLYKTILILVSTIISILYLVRYRQLPFNSEFKWFTMTIIGLNLWNIVSTSVMSNLILNIKDLDSYYERMKSSNQSLEKLFHTQNHLLNHQFLLQDMKILSFITINFLIMKKFINTFCRLSEKIGSMKNIDVETVEKIHPVIKKPGKSLSVFLFITVMMIISLPSRLYFNSLAVLVQYNEIIIKTDHLFWSISIFFIVDNIHKFLYYLNKIDQLPKFQVMLIYFIWFYDYLIIILTNCLLILFNDLSMNCLKLVSNIINNNNLYEETDINFLTSILLNYIKHLTQYNCNDCNIFEIINLMSYNLIYYKQLFISCLVVLNISGLVIIPLFIWIIMVELKYKLISN